jgi:tRNA (guanine-N7-)-methyltransferase
LSAAQDSTIRFYGRRKGKPLKAGRQGLLETLLPALRIARPEAPLDPARLFPTAPRAVRLEIGFGSGEHLAAQAAANPDVGFIGCEVFLNGVASLLRHIDAGRLANVRIFDDDARFLLPMIPANSLERISLLFPDPWPKARHAKRRFVNTAMLDTCARLLVPGGELRVASDDPGYIRWTLAHASLHPAFRWLAAGPDDWRVRPSDSVATRYEGKAIMAGRRPMFLNFAKRAASP